MENIKITTQVVEVIEHEFYCDDCGKCIGRSEEYDDGYYERFGELAFHFNLKDIGWYSIEKCLCDDCKEKYIDELKETLQKIGFTKDD